MVKITIRANIIPRIIFNFSNSLLSRPNFRQPLSYKKSLRLTISIKANVKGISGNNQGQIIFILLNNYINSRTQNW